MQYKNYLCRKRARFDGISGQVNIPYGTALICQDGFLMHQNKPLCGITSQNAYDFFSQNDDGMGRERGDLDSGYQARWNKVWEDARCQKYKRPEHEDHWIWNFDFYNGPVEDLRHIAGLIGA